MTRGIDNNNPGNIRRSNIAWEGLAPTQTDPAFSQFVNPEYGIRAIAKILKTYQREGLTTIRQMISHWAPPEDHNDTSAYIKNVAAACGVDPDTSLDLAFYMPRIVAAIIHQENGVNPYSSDIIEEGTHLA
jgi:hypothetical protein